MIPFVIYLLSTLILPIGIIVVFILKKKVKLKVVLIGLLSFFIPQLLIRIPLLTFIQFQYPSLYLSRFFQYSLPFTAGIFEVVGDYIGIRIFLKNSTLSDGIVLGAAHGLCENFIFSIMPVVASLTVVESFHRVLYMATLDRFSATIVHIVCAIFAYYSVKNRKILFLIFGILIHAAVDMPIEFISNKATLSLVIFGITLITLLITIPLILKSTNEYIKKAKV